MELAASYIRNGGKVLEKAIEYLSRDAAKAFKRWADDIADFLENLVKKWDDYEEYASEYVRDQLRNFLKKKTKLSDGIIEEIVDAVEWLLWFIA